MNATELTELTETELQNLKESLLFQKSTILNKSHEFKEEQSSMAAVADEAEAASQDISNNISIHLHERDRTALYAIERALGKIADGTYGQCESCSEIINGCSAFQWMARLTGSRIITCCKSPTAR